MTHDIALDFALNRLKAFRATFNDDEQVDEESGLTAADLSVVIEAAERGAGVVGIRYLDLSKATDKDFR